jgi:CheY-like chemotaxis protein
LSAACLIPIAPIYYYAMSVPMKQNILLVDDDQVFNFLSTKVLHRMGITEGIHTATNGRDALELIKESFTDHNFPDIIFLDINMPIMDGFGFIEAFKKMNMPEKEKVVIAIVTSSQDSNDIRRAKELGITHYLTKPISEKTLRPVLESAGKLRTA